MKRLTVFWALLACLLLAAPAMAVETTATGKVVATVTRDVRLPFNAVIDEVLRQREAGVPLKQQAVLFRSAHHSDGLEVELVRRREDQAHHLELGMALHAL